MAESIILLGIGAGDTIPSFILSGLQPAALSGIAFNFSAPLLSFESDKGALFADAHGTAFENNKSTTFENNKGTTFENDKKVSIT